MMINCTQGATVCLQCMSSHLVIPMTAFNCDHYYDKANLNNRSHHTSQSSRNGRPTIVSDVCSVGCDNDSINGAEGGLKYPLQSSDLSIFKL